MAKQQRRGDSQQVERQAHVSHGSLLASNSNLQRAQRWAFDCEIVRRRSFEIVFAALQLAHAGARLVTTDVDAHRRIRPSKFHIARVHPAETYGTILSWFAKTAMQIDANR